MRILRTRRREPANRPTAERPSSYADGGSTPGAGPHDQILVDCVVRSDARLVHGGDLVQVEEYTRHLEGTGVDLRQVPFHPAMRFRTGAVVHVFNIDRPFDFVSASRMARGHVLIVSPIHHNAVRVGAMRAAVRGRGAVQALSRALPDPVREWVASAVRALRRAEDLRGRVAAVRMAVRTAADVPHVWHRAGAALDGARAVALLAEGEGDDLRALTGWSADNAVVVPNGRPEDLDVAATIPWADRAAGSILVVGRIEARKRPLEVARAAAELGIPVAFIGPATDDGDAYTREFLALAGGSDSVSYLGPKPREEVLRTMARSRVLVNASWVEVQSLVDLEAACLGCAVVATPAGHSKEWLGAAVTVLPDGDPGALLREAARLAASAVGPDDAVVYPWTWADASRLLRGVYERSS